MIAYCGIACAQCPTFLAAKKDDDQAREKVAREWSQQFGFDLKPADINCEGCLAEGGRLFGHCQVCEIRKCGREKEVENCAYCGDYACEKLTKFFKIAPYAREALEKIRQGP